MGRNLVVYRDVVLSLPKHPRVNGFCRRVAEAGAAGARRRVAVDTGRLRDSITVQETEHGWQWGTDVDYAVYQEYGTWKMRAHPFIRPSVFDALREAARVR
jgi:HK97 gp10 family phage protein